MRFSLSQALVVFALFLLVGPLAGAFFFALLVTLVSAIEGEGLGLLFLYGTLAFLPLAYLVGGLQAAFVGLATALFGWFKGAPPAWVPVAAALAAGGLVAARSHEQWDLTAALVAVHVLAAFVCWALTRALTRGRSAGRA